WRLLGSPIFGIKRSWTLGVSTVSILSKQNAEVQVELWRWTTTFGNTRRLSLLNISKSGRGREPLRIYPIKQRGCAGNGGRPSCPVNAGSTSRIERSTVRSNRWLQIS